MPVSSHGGYAPRVPRVCPRDPNPLRAATMAAAFCLVFVASGRAATAAGEGAAVLVDEIVAVVDGRQILLTDLELQARLAKARRDGPSWLQAPLDARLLEASLSQMIDELVVVGQADKLQVFRVAPTEIDAGVQELRTAIGAAAYDQFMNENEVVDLTIREVVERGLRARHYLEGRFRLASKPKDAEIAAYFAAHAEEFKGHQLADMASLIRERLTREKFDELTRNFVNDVRGRAVIRILRVPGAAAGDTPMSGRATADAGPQTRAGE